MDLRIRLLLVIKVYFCFHLTTNANECHDARQADIIFALDGSGSVGVSQFTYSLNFVSQLVDAFPIGSSATQVALIIFNNASWKEFDLNTYQGAAELKRAVLRTQLI
ncbi:collagen alpha-1(XII) chain-like isoform X2 [Ruditapes philippinarum]|uniref:collagen alpha-1(XII) chain-like isoform X2 n=1 Tax=Ruditapes philippinarum TaxID=129788 RepID=UPI00295C25B7|nr:collagen alpha-1(XII) chain-like isoform X2 [Ruditapes philippinarum]